jgi:NADPH:quinone reductase-like Zn-dependent oxidoreductase
MRALQFSTYGGPEVLQWAEAPEPHAGPGQIRITVRQPRWIRHLT